MLNINNHSRDNANMIYVYPVISRRAGGVSIGINLNVNNACNWACVYCQVPNLARGGPPPINLHLLEYEFRMFLDDAIDGDFLIRQVPPEARRLMDVAFSGNGEPTSALEFYDAVCLVERGLRDKGLLQGLKLRLITNGSFIHRKSVLQGIARIGELNGEVWFKVDKASEAGIEQVNKVRLTPERIRLALLQCAELAPTWVQSCYFAIDEKESDESEQKAYLEFIESIRKKINGVHLYGLARPSLQPGAERLSSLPLENFKKFARQISSLGVDVVVNP